MEAGKVIKWSRTRSYCTGDRQVEFRAGQTDGPEPLQVLSMLVRTGLDSGNTPESPAQSRGNSLLSSDVIGPAPPSSQRGNAATWENIMDHIFFGVQYQPSRPCQARAQALS